MEVAAPVTAKPYNPRRRGVMLAMLTSLYTLSYVDRTIIGTVGEAIKRELLLTDTQLGMLHGLSFSILYIGLTIPFARFAERHNRVRLISFCVVLWSICTTTLGLVSNFTGLFAARICVGIGEAGTTPASQSMIADAYAPKERGRALGTLLLGIPLGMLIGAVVGGWVTGHFGWRAAFIVLGVPGILLGLALTFIVREPPRGWSEGKTAASTTAPPGFLHVFRSFVKSPAIVQLSIAKALVTTFIYCSAGFTVPFFIRAFQLNYAKVGAVYGLAVGIGYGVGAVVGAIAIDRMAPRDVRWYGWLPMATSAAAVPVFLAAYLASTWLVAALALCLGSALLYASIPPGSASFHNTLDPRTRATSTSMLFVIENVLPLAIGPVLLGYFIDVFAGHAFVATGLQDFKTHCPGGVAAAGSAAHLVEACRTSLADGTRYSLVALSLLPLWGAFHYWVHARALKRQAG